MRARVGVTRRGRGSRTGTALAIMLAVLGASTFVLVASASAGSLGKKRGLEYIVSSPVKVGAQDGRQAFCPDGDGVIGGGGAIEGPAKGVTLNETYPDSGMQSWWTAEGSAKGAKKRELRAYAICTANIPVTLVTEPPTGYQLGSNETVNNLRGCPSGSEYPSSGGASATGAGIELLDNLYIGSGFPGWSTTVTNPTMTDTVVFFHTACVPPDRPRPVRSSKTKRVSPGKAATAIAGCRPGEVVEGGGWRSTGPMGQGTRPAAAQITRPWDSDDKGRTPEDGWMVKVRNSGDERLFLTASAGCRAVAD